MIKRNKLLIGAALLGGVALVLASIATEAETSPAPEYADVESAYTAALEDTIECLRSQGFDASAEVNFTGILHSIGIKSDGAAAGTREHEATTGIEDGLLDCETRYGLQDAVDLMLEYLDPTVADRGAMAAECASPLGIDLVADADEPEARFSEVYRTEEGRVCVETKIAEHMQARAADLRGRSSRN